MGVNTKNNILRPALSQQSKLANNKAQPVTEVKKASELSSATNLATAEASKPLKKFTEIHLDGKDPRVTPDIKHVLKYFAADLDKDKKEQAVLSEDGKTLVVSLSGENAYKGFFKATPLYLKPVLWIKQLVGKIGKLFGGKGYLKQDLGLQKYREMFLPSKNSNLTHRAEDEKHFIQNLRNNHYHAQVAFTYCEKHKQFRHKPEMITITDSLHTAAKKIGLDHDARKRYKHDYMIDKAIPIRAKNFNILNDMFDAFMTGIPGLVNQLYVNFTIPGLNERHAVKDYPTMLPLQKIDGSWETAQNDYSKLHIFKDPSLGQVELGPNLAEILAQIQTTSGPVDRSVDHKDVINEAIEYNKKILV